MAWASVYSVGSKYGKKGYNSAKKFAKGSKSFKEWGVWLVALIGCFLLYRIVKPMILMNSSLMSAFGVTRSDQEIAQSEGLSQIPFYEGGLTVDESALQQVADNYYDAMMSLGTSEMQVLRASLKDFERWMNIHVRDYGTEFTLQSMKDAYYTMNDDYKFSNDDRVKIVQLYDIRKLDWWGEAMSLPQAINEENIGDMGYNFIKWLHIGTGVVFP